MGTFLFFSGDRWANNGHLSLEQEKKLCQNLEMLMTHALFTLKETTVVVINSLGSGLVHQLYFRYSGSPIYYQKWSTDLKIKLVYHT